MSDIPWQRDIFACGREVGVFIKNFIIIVGLVRSPTVTVYMVPGCNIGDVARLKVTGLQKLPCTWCMCIQVQYLMIDLLHVPTVHIVTCTGTSTRTLFVLRKDFSREKIKVQQLLHVFYISVCMNMQWASEYTGYNSMLSLDV